MDDVPAHHSATDAPSQEDVPPQEDVSSEEDVPSEEENVPPEEEEDVPSEEEEDILPQEDVWLFSQEDNSSETRPTKGNAREEICAICLAEMENTVILTECWHPFHYDCLIGWSKVQYSCPTCRREMDLREVELYWVEGEDKWEALPSQGLETVHFELLQLHEKKEMGESEESTVAIGSEGAGDVLV
ncbi:hypothetical protein B0T21DRAFT_408627 [Apiosordaria backusii]|uniref:RING-type domain-containing protein n=1 Tax=Apiosordaria backusii TaxID=314023 RepID=A0AA40K0V2_9PEZI|nr:hypothetical protein B0T21DRAFT_408627 [Apiosordaria backusii]